MKSCVSTNRKLFRTRASAIFYYIFFSICLFFHFFLDMPIFAWTSEVLLNWMDNSIANHTRRVRRKKNQYFVCNWNCDHRCHWNYRRCEPNGVLCENDTNFCCHFLGNLPSYSSHMVNLKIFDNVRRRCVPDNSIHTNIESILFAPNIK